MHKKILNSSSDNSRFSSEDQPFRYRNPVRRADPSSLLYAAPNVYRPARELLYLFGIFRGFDIKNRAKVRGGGPARNIMKKENAGGFLPYTTKTPELKEIYRASHIYILLYIV